MQKIISSLWFITNGGKVEELHNYYKGVFGENYVVIFSKDLGDTPSGHAELSEVDIFGYRYTLMSTAKEQAKFNDAFSLTIYCKDQDEIDKYWDYFVKEGKAVACGWCIDKYGLRWQIIPENMNELLSREGAMQVMMKQVKIIISEYN